MLPRVGFGWDLHRLAPGLTLRLGGIDIASPLGCVAHSDGDVLLHALTDALLGALARPDLGETFPDRDPVNRGRDSADFLRHALAEMKTAGYRLGNLDTTVILESPKLSSYKTAIRARLAELCACPVDCVAVKAKTGEKLDAVGRGEACAVQAAVLLVPEAAR